MRGILTTVGKYGFKVEGDDNWHNFARNRTQVFTEHCIKLKGKEIEWEENKDNLVARLGTPDKNPVKKTENKPAKGLLVKSFSDSCIKGLEEQINEFGTTKEIKKVETHPEGTRWVAFVWYV